MKGNLRFGLIALIVLSLGSAPDIAKAFPIIDQKSPIDPNATTTIAIGGASEQILAQVVTTGISGLLLGINLPLFGSSGDLLVQIQGVTNGRPDGSVLLTESFPASDIPAPVDGFRALRFSNPIAFSAGNIFSFVLSTTSSFGIAPSLVVDSYAGGSAFFDSRPNPVGVWKPLNIGGNPDDLAFQSVVVAAPPSDTADSFLQSGGNKNFNEGANHVLVVDKKGTKRTVVDFDLSAITTQVVSSARLVFTLERPTQDWGSTGGTVDAHRLTAPFTEGNGFTWEQTLGLGDRGTGSGVTWNCASDTGISNKKTDCDARWKGGSQASESVTDSAVITNGQTGEVSWDVTVDVQAALTEQATAIQWLIRKTQEHRKGQAVFYSKEGAADMGDVTKAPRLELEFVE